MSKSSKHKLEYMKSYYAANKLKRDEYYSEWRKSNIGKLKDYQDNLRKQCLAMYGDSCSICGSKVMIHLHHIYFDGDEDRASGPRYKMLLESHRDDIQPLCRKHHRKLHSDIQKQNTKLIANGAMCFLPGGFR